MKCVCSGKKQVIGEKGMEWVLICKTGKKKR